MITYNIAAESDAPAIAALAREIWTEHYEPLIGGEQVAYMLANLQSPGRIAADIASGVCYHVAREEGRPLGYLAIAAREDHLFLSKLYVQKAARGRGIARGFLEIAQAAAGEMGLCRIRLTVNKGNAGSIAAYQKMGFAIADEVVADIGGGYVMDDYIMEKAL